MFFYRLKILLLRILGYEKPLRVFFNTETDYNKISRIGGLKKNIGGNFY